MNKILQRAPILWKVRNCLRAQFFKSLGHILDIKDTRDLLLATLTGYTKSISDHYFASALLAEKPYRDVGRIPSLTAPTKTAIFVTGRFRSGSTLVWNLFRNLPGFTAYYEPLNERRWFDSRTRGDTLDETHKNVENYWAEYDDLDVLGDYYQVRWNCRDLYMDETAWDESLKKYIQILVDRAPNQPVLQFNRIDFRLPWIRKHFPAAKIVHLYRHPRDQWCSFLGQPFRFPSSERLHNFATYDVFYLIVWANDLKHHFPFLNMNPNSHPYELFYQIWKLSYLFGKKYADYSLSFETLVTEPKKALDSLFGFLKISANVDDITHLIVAPPLNKWKDYASVEWFERIEVRVDEQINRYFSEDSAASG